MHIYNFNIFISNTTLHIYSESESTLHLGESDIWSAKYFTYQSHVIALNMSPKVLTALVPL